MNNNILFFAPVFKDLIWGGDKMAKEYGYNIPSPTTGECWEISAHPHGDCTCITDGYKGMKLSELWTAHPELFVTGTDNGIGTTTATSTGTAKSAGKPAGEFPLILKVIDAKDNLSVQVHPTDEYARTHENGASGKTECWYVLDCEPDSELIAGHNAHSREEISRLIDEGRTCELIRTVKVNPGDCLFIKAGTVHSIKGGVMLLELQQNSDITYRIYDYDRVRDGKKRELHTEKAKETIALDGSECNAFTTPATPGVHKIADCKYFDEYRINVCGTESFAAGNTFAIFFVTEGEGSADGTPVKKGDSFLLTAGSAPLTLTGNMTLIAATPGSDI